LRAESAISGDLTHPRSFGTTARLLGEFVRDRSVVDWETAVHKMTLGPAAKMNLLDRGVIAPKAFADIVVLNPETIQDIATFTQPYQYPTGITWVLVNGTVAVEQGTYTGAKNGKILRK
jgi:N-acyl-D-aspartate/D-glutamate deacylase